MIYLLTWKEFEKEMCSSIVLPLRRHTRSHNWFNLTESDYTLNQLRCPLLQFSAFLAVLRLQSHDNPR